MKWTPINALNQDSQCAKIKNCRPTSITNLKPKCNSTCPRTHSRCSSRTFGSKFNPKTPCSLSSSTSLRFPQSPMELLKGTRLIRIQDIFSPIMKIASVLSPIWLRPMSKKNRSPFSESTMAIRERLKLITLGITFTYFSWKSKSSRGISKWLWKEP